jgi:hypothetical protein
VAEKKIVNVGRSSGNKGKERKKSRKEQELEKPDYEVTVFASDSPKDIKEDVTLVARAMSQNWQIPEALRKKTLEFWNKTYDQPDVSAAVKAKVASSIVMLEKLRLESAKADFVIRREEGGMYGRLGNVESKSEAEFDALLSGCQTPEEVEVIIAILQRNSDAKQGIVNAG